MQTLLCTTSQGCASSVAAWATKLSGQQPTPAPAALPPATTTASAGGGAATPAAATSPALSSAEAVAAATRAGSTMSCLRHGSAAATSVSVLLTEELASGRSQLERGYRQLPLGVPLKEWGDLHVRMWLLTLPAVLRPYTDMLCSPGGLLLEWSDELLAEAGVSNAFHRKQLLEYVRQLQADVATHLTEQQQDRQRQLQRHQGGAGPVAPDRRPKSLAPPGLIPGSIDSPQSDGGDDDSAYCERTGASVTAAEGHGGGLRTTAARSPSAKQHPSDGPMGRDASPDLGPGLRTPAKSVSPRRRRSLGNSGSVNSSSGGGVRASGRELLAEYEQGLLEKALPTLKLLVREAGSMCPWPGDAAAQLLASLLDMGERALVNKRNWQQLNTRAVDLLQLIARNKQLQSDTHSYRNIMHRLINTLKLSSFTRRLLIRY
ncbi:hypothetical protein VOLCADRAFT_91346 [Volvox carteri f. nagariensis]|uniref:SAM domain-containing protein n=1 Tax=Volvox carteri f. nagariensis TaxID=3068 RepID=D8TWU2_VOLCA|nr:uncharacterized protein VOLCADRAFT_91346 [Volvox carteri f. nagariensis]EFJ48108.1 hypothetical protein VOLCADRAFT_91346 [Volvox carteri f. nagariensis]|eukprot:XP_002950793.1 hypothetical protein VOLCADRAFT_91346 [Volvox carteri f. nagariensis]